MKTNILTNEQKKLVEENYNLIYAVIPKIAASDFYDIEPEDLEQIALLHLCGAAAEYDPASDCVFSTYAVNYIRMRIFDEFAAKRRKNADYHAGRAVITDDDGNELDISEIAVAEENAEKRTIYSGTLLSLKSEIEILKMKSSGNEVAAQIIEEILNGTPQPDAIRKISNSRGIAYSYCSRVLREFREKLKNYAIREGIYV